MPFFRTIVRYFVEMDFAVEGCCPVKEWWLMYPPVWLESVQNINFRTLAAAVHHWEPWISIRDWGVWWRKWIQWRVSDNRGKLPKPSCSMPPSWAAPSSITSTRQGINSKCHAIFFTTSLLLNKFFCVFFSLKFLLCIIPVFFLDQYEVLSIHNLVWLLFFCYILTWVGSVNCKKSKKFGEKTDFYNVL